MITHASVLFHSRARTLLLLAALGIAPGASAQLSPPDASLAPPPSGSTDEATAPSSPPLSKKDIVHLTPFEVNESQNQGYQATSTMSGTRLNSNLADLAASLSVVTKQQILDTAATDINDLFKYETNTEGSSQFTQFSVDRGVVTDGVSTNPNGANRIRGLTSANAAIDGFSIILPIDTYNVEAVEISRGPNSTVFGLGNTGGGYNVVASKANAQRAITSFTTRGDSYDGYRGTFDINRPIWRDRVAVRVLGLYEEKGYERKPSRDTTRRLDATVTVRPFKSTNINARFESYRNYNNRPNTLTPRDTLTDWVNSGKPTWDPLNQTVHFGNGAPAITGVTTTLEAALLPYGIATSDSTFQGSPSDYFENNGKLGLFTINRLPAATGVGPNNIAGAGRLLQDGNYYIRNSTTNPLFNAAEISKKSYYDWTKINLVAPNFATTAGETSFVEVDQSILRTDHHSLDVQGAWLYERIDTYDRRFLGSGGASLEPYIDINETQLDGTPNPYFLRPYVGGAAPSFSKGYNNTENYRGTLAYELNLTQVKSFLHWLGRNRFTGYGQYTAGFAANLGYQDAISSNNTWFGGTPTTRKGTSFFTYPRYYVGDNVGQNVDYAPARTLSPPYAYPLRYYNGVTGQWVTENVTYDAFYDANRPSKRILGTVGGVWQGFFWNNRILPLFGARHDVSRSRDSNSAINPTAATNGYYDTSPLGTYSVNDWVQNRGNTTNFGIVGRPLSWLDLTYSQSNAFSPGSQLYDVYGVPLPDPRGQTKDYGFQFNLFHNKLKIVAKQYETTDIGRSTSDLNTIVQRTDRMDRRTASGDPGLTDWLTTQLMTVHPEWTSDQVLAEVKTETGVDPDYIRSHINKTHGDASNSVSRGQEVELNYNPNNFWTMKLTGSRSNPLNGILSPKVQSYIDARMPTWTTIKDPVTGNNWWTSPEASNNTVPRDFYINNVLAPLKLAIALQGKRRTQTREYHLSYLTNFRLEGITENRWLRNADVGGSVRWEDKASIGFYGAPPDSDGIVRLYDPNRPIYDKARYYFDLHAGYNLRFDRNRIHARVQLNVNNVFEDGRLQVVAANPDGTPWAFRIIDPRQFILSVRFDL